MFHISSLQLLVKESQTSESSVHLRDALQSSLFYLHSCQSSLIAVFLSRRRITRNELNYRLQNLANAERTVRFSSEKIRPNDHVFSSLFLFQTFQLVQIFTRLFSKAKTAASRQTIFSCDHLFVLDRSRFLSALKSVLIIGVGSIFVVVPHLSRVFNSGQWILIALCMTQSDNVGSAFLIMKMRLSGTLLGKNPHLFELH